ncbi:MAG: hypothetical protein A2275_08325 [Bacteroidetes bacterium RIFOXYA12_FULL_35_11]|nr:MAG: hypothetical protein A2X01_11060 [Bacteroidetes bacterium GWF2_35_48]OFY75839.1 MAG: hypothetical protein A2275_08325 [Bacteroidetes bacterium RIFOXYA12_FULL_35_11]OFY95605.1 MAG: hypothetical protein A2309_06385 [Bacteroidetes bacterium RIFOXYB2_FULL_35_7]OFY99513.1 MAG: hypothetical protein A2491_05050 [Bacteroidetes bacterium RIFOXYC12_FULL_35_7]HBX53239.1 hypothetical protein [Bacteroidales bacterium]
MIRYTSTLILLIFTTVAFLASAQNQNEKKLDSLLKRAKSVTDTAKANTLNEIALVYLNVNDLDKVLQYAKEADKLSSEISYSFGKLRALNYIGKVEKRNNNYDKALELYQTSLKLSESLSDTLWISRNINNIGEIYYEQNKFSEAIEYYEKSLRLKQLSRDKKGEGITLNSIGQIYIRWGKNEEAIKILQNSLQIFDSLKTDEGSLFSAKVMNSIGNLYQNTNVGNDTLRIGQAIIYYNQALSICKKLDRKKETAEILISLGNAYVTKSDVHKTKLDRTNTTKEDKEMEKNLFLNLNNQAIYHYESALEIFKSINDSKGIAMAYSNISFTLTDVLKFDPEQTTFNKILNYSNEAIEISKNVNNKLEIAFNLYIIARSYFFMKNYANAIIFLNQSHQIAVELKVPKNILNDYILYSEIYEQMGDYKNAFIYSRKSSQLQDTLTNEASLKSIQEMQTKYETEKKEADIKLLNADKALQEKEIRQQRMVIIGFVVGFVLILIFSIIIYKQYRDKRRANILLAQQKEEISMQRDEIEKQKEIAEHQRDEITEQKREIDDSIRYAKRIQNAVMPLAENISKYVSEIFIMFKPKDVVSGDFYFVKHIETSNVVVIAASDCTGHGVPGAFMSMLGLTFMNEICTKPEVQHSGEVLNLLRTYIINSLHQTGKTGEQKDGMDISLIVIYPDKKKIEFSGANNPLFLIRNDELIEYKGDRMPVGIHDKMDTSFTTNEISYHENDRFYMFSDGFADQFGGPKAKKFLYKNFKQLLLSHHTESMVEQKNIYEKTSVEWRGNIEQIDDQLIIGVKM